MVLRCERLFAWSLRHPWGMLSIGAVLTVAAVFGILRLQIQSNFVALLPQDQPSVVELKHLDQLVGGASFVIVTLETPDPTLAPPFLEALATRLRKQSGVRYLDYRPPVEFFRRHALLYLSLPELEKFSQQIEHRLDQLKLQPLMIDLSQPEERLSLDQFEQRYPFIRDHTYYQNRDGTLYVLLIKPEGRPSDTQFTRQFLADIEANIAATRAQLGDQWLATDRVQVRLTGPYVKALQQLEQITADGRRITLLGLIGTTLLLWLYFRHKRVVALVGIPVAVGVTWAMGLAYVYYGHLNFFTSSACAILMGLSADYSIHFYSHYVDAARRGLATIPALLNAYRELSRPLLLAVLAPAGAFFSLALTNFSALAQFGVIAGSGILCTFVAVFLLFPALTILLARRSPIAFRDSPQVRVRALTRRLFHRLTSPRGFLVTSGALAGLIGALGWGLPHFDYNFNHLLGTQATKQLDRRVDRIFSYSINPEIARAQSAADANAFAQAIRSARDIQRTHPTGTTMQTALALGDFVPTQQAEKRQRIAQLRTYFTPALVDLMPREERQVYERLKPALSPDEITNKKLPEDLLTKYRDLAGNLGQFFYIFPAFDRQDGTKLNQFIHEMRSVACPDCQHPVVISGETVIFHDIVQQLRAEGPVVLGTSLTAIFLSLWLVFRRLRHALLCVLPLGVSIAATLGAMRILGLQFNLVNVALVPMILGAGIDYAIYLYQQTSQREDGHMAIAYCETAPPIFASALTTSVGFGTLMFADNGGAASFGLVTTLGISLCALVILLWFPGFLAWTARWRAPVIAREVEVAEAATS